MAITYFLLLVISVIQLTQTLNMAVKCKNETKIFMENILYYYECLIKRLTYEMYSSIERIKVLKVSI